MKLCGIINVWNTALWLPYCLESAYGLFDQLLIVEACWIQHPEWDHTTSPDGSAEIIRQWIAEHDHAGKVQFIQAGQVQSIEAARNYALDQVAPDTDFIWVHDSDEFYTPEQAAQYRFLLERLPAKFGNVTVPARCFYFDFFHCKLEPFNRIFRWFPGQRFYAISSAYPGGETLTLQDPALAYWHYSYVSESWTRIKSCMGVDVSKEQYQSWWDRIYSQYDGSNLKDLYNQNGGGIHVFGGGPLESYDGPHPAVLEHHPLRHERWKGVQR
jgi:glycosyltransferase involved in cell wall biosynthesis